MISALLTPNKMNGEDLTPRRLSKNGNYISITP
jgi:hypothetical protein